MNTVRLKGRVNNSANTLIIPPIFTATNTITVMNYFEFFFSFLYLSYLLSLFSVPFRSEIKHERNLCSKQTQNTLKINYIFYF